jgi:predicted O-methyltransferase YrrM
MTLYYSRKAIGRAAKRLIGRPTFPPSRYRHLYEWLSTHGAERILEIGTNDGFNAVQMVRAASHRSANVAYYGFDLFERQGQEERLREFSIRAPAMEQVHSYLIRRGLKDPILVAGDSNITLREHLPSLPEMDVVFIDGGHSVATVANDWTLVRQLVGSNTCVFFDDYPNWGVGPVVDSIPAGIWNVDILPTSDVFADHARGELLTCQLVRVSRRS